MTCPDLERLFAALHEDGAESEIDAHLATCSECRENLKIIREIPSLFRPEERIPEGLLGRTMAALGAEGGAVRYGRVAGLQVLVAGVLGLLTALFILLGTDVGGSPEWMVLLSLAVGGVCGAFRAQAGSGPREGA